VTTELAVVSRDSRATLDQTVQSRLSVPPVSLTPVAFDLRASETKRSQYATVSPSHL
jgi:hypothetical protein